MKSLPVKHLLLIIVQQREKLEFKRGEAVLEEVEQFCYLGDIIICYGGASEAGRCIDKVEGVK